MQRGYGCSAATGTVLWWVFAGARSGACAAGLQCMALSDCGGEVGVRLGLCIGM